MNAPAPVVFIHDDEIFVRMTPIERWQHILLAASFVVLLTTGLLGIFERGAGHAWRGILHRSAALVLIGDYVWHLLYTALTERGRRNLRDMRPCRQDGRDALSVFRRHAPDPEFGRFGIAEKFEYWSHIWGSAVMIATGVFIWVPGHSLRLFPLALHQVFVVIHGYEAILAFLAVLIWHMYTVHLKPGVFPMSRVWLDGRITGAKLKRFHPLEYRRLWEDRERLYMELLLRDAGPDRPGSDGLGPPAAL
jgi:cytochrome b subunit of formate dehydrogenase